MNYEIKNQTVSQNRKTKYLLSNPFCFRQLGVMTTPTSANSFDMLAFEQWCITQMIRPMHNIVSVYCVSSLLENTLFYKKYVSGLCEFSLKKMVRITLHIILHAQKFKSSDVLSRLYIPSSRLNTSFYKKHDYSIRNSYTLFFYKKPSKRPSPQSFLKKWPLEPSKFLNSFLNSRIVF